MWDPTVPGGISAKGWMLVMSRYVLAVQSTGTRTSEKSRHCNGKKKCEIWEDYGSVTEVMGEENSITLKCLNKYKTELISENILYVWS